MKSNEILLGTWAMKASLKKFVRWKTMENMSKHICTLGMLLTYFFVGQVVAANLNTGTLYTDIIKPNGTSLNIWYHYNTSEVDALINSCYANDTTISADVDSVNSSLNSEISTRQSEIAECSANITSVNDSLNNHIGNASNPHGVTAAQVGAATAIHNHAGSDITSQVSDCDTVDSVHASSFMRSDTDWTVNTSLTTGVNYHNSNKRALLIASGSCSTSPNADVLVIYSDSSANPTTLRTQCGTSSTAAICTVFSPIQPNDFFRIETGCGLSLNTVALFS